MDKIKLLFMNHVEKIVAVGCSLLGVMALASASWSPAPAETANDISNNAEKSMNAIRVGNPWPDEEQQLFTDIPNVLDITSDENKQLTQASDFTLIPFKLRSNRLKEKRTTPTILAAVSPVADYIQFVLAMPPEEEEEEDGEDDSEMDGDKEEDEEEEDEFEKRLREKYSNNGSATAGGGAGAGQPGMGQPGGGGAGRGMGMSGGAGGRGGPGDMGGGPGMGMGTSGGAGGRGAPGDMGGGPGMGGPGMGMGSSGGGAGGRGAPGDMGGGPGMGGPGMGMSMGGDYESQDLYSSYGSGLMSTKKRVRPSAGVSVRLVIDIQQQRKELARALHLKGGFAAAQPFIQYMDIQVERRAVNSLGQAEEWVPVTSEDLGEILKDSFGTDMDIVNPVITRNTITMPLPRRVAGRWSPAEASHPRVEKFELSDEEKKLIDQLNSVVKKQMEKNKANQDEEAKPGGFSDFSSSAVDVSTSQYSADMGYDGGEGDYEMDDDYGSEMSDMSDMYSSELGGEEGLTNEQQGLIDTTLQTAENRLLLVRFMDFTIERGYSYQYRVRLEMKNPNYRHPLEELEDPAMAAEPTLISDWSEATPVVFVPVGQRLYLTDVSDRSSGMEEVDVEIYSDSPETGMPVIGKIEVRPGMKIADRDNIELVDLTRDVLERKDVVVGSNDILATAEAFGKLSRSEHEELEEFILSVDRGIEQIPDEICVLNARGDLELRSVGDKSSQLSMDRQEIAFIIKQYEAWRVKKATDSGSPFGQDAGEYGGYDAGDLGMDMGSSASGDFYSGGDY